MAEITINKTEYELLVRQSEQVRIVERMLLEDEFTSANDIRIILGVPKRKGTEDV